MSAFAYWPELAIMSLSVAIGSILLGHFEAGLPKWRRILKVFIGCALGVGISAALGRAAFWGFLGLLLGMVVLIHAWWLPRHGVNGWTAEPRERYYRLRGWKWPPAAPR